MAAEHGSLPPLVHEDERRTLTATEQWARRLLSPFQAFARLQVAGGVLLLACTVLALLWANSRWADYYQHLLHEPLGIFLGKLQVSFSLHHWINDALMAVFFFAVGLEIKREFMVGELAEPRKAALPIAAAIGGMVVPALIFWGMNQGTTGARGWGVPMATDIAFALGALTLLGSRVPEALKVFLVALAIVDDLGAVLVIAVFYTSGIAWGALGLAGAGLVALVVANLAGARHPMIYAALGLVVWFGVLESGVHATIAGVLVAMTIPVRERLLPEGLVAAIGRAADTLQLRNALGPRHLDRTRFQLVATLGGVLDEAKAPLLRFEHAVHPWVTFAIMPVFALANAGVAIGASAAASLGSPVPLGIVLGLVVGKQVGVFGASWLAVRTGLAALPAGATWRQVYGTAWLAGIGFTMSLFISVLAFAGTGFEDQAKLGILVGSLISAIGGVVILMSTPATSQDR
jgi:NhaA family Na+:H+ antiporter